MTDPWGVDVGDRFERASQPGRVFRIVGLRDIPHMPLHAVLARENGHERITLAVSALGDPKMWRKVQA
jgi:hypothetical protein